jgi:arylsulfatase A-like enzyme
VNILLVTLDQFRADCLSCAGHPLVKTPHLDALAADGLRLARHYSQAAPCGPGRASLYTGLYQMNHRVVANGTPLDARFDNVALAARRAGYAPALFGYTDQAFDPRAADGPGDPRLVSYEEVLPGFDPVCHLPSGAPAPWLKFLKGQDFDFGDDAVAALRSEPEREEDLSMASFLTDRFLGWMRRQDRPWFAHLSHLRPHPPYAAAGRFADMYDPADVPAPIAAGDQHPLLAAVRQLFPRLAAPADPAVMRRLAAQYFGMVSEVDYQLGRVWAALRAAGQWDDTMIVVTADHGEQLGDHGLMQKLGYFEQSYHVLGIIRDPRPTAVRGAVSQAFTENVDLLPTLCDAMGLPIPAQCDGASLAPLLRGETPAGWREAAHWEYDWRFLLGSPAAAWDPAQERQSLAVRRDAVSAYVQLADGQALAFDLAADPTWRTALTDPAAVLTKAQAMLAWRAQHLDRTLSGALIDHGVTGRPPADAGASDVPVEPSDATINK